MSRIHKVSNISHENIKSKLLNYKFQAIEFRQAKEAAVAIILQRICENEIKVLFIKRSENPDDPWSGHMAFPGGRKESYDKTILQTVIREVHEEIGFDLHLHSKHLTRLDDIHAIARGKHIQMIISPFVFLVDNLSELVMNDEVVEIHKIPLTSIIDRSFHSTYKNTMGNKTFVHPCFRYKGRVIWGLTYRMLENFLKIIQS